MGGISRILATSFITLMLVHPSCLCPRSRTGITAAFLYCGGYLLQRINSRSIGAKNGIVVPDDLFYSLHVLGSELEGDLWIVLCAVPMLYSFSTAKSSIGEGGLRRRLHRCAIERRSGLPGYSHAAVRPIVAGAGRAAFVEEAMSSRAQLIRR